MRRTALLLLVSVVLVACAEDPPPTGSGPTGPASWPAPSAEPIEAARIDIYESLARELVGAEAVEWKRIVIVSELCENAGEPRQMRGCDDILSTAEQDELAGRLDDLAPTISFTEDPTSLYDEEWFNGAPEIIVLRLGTIEEKDDGVEVGGSFGCGGLCGSGTTYLLERTDDGWEVVGTTGPGWIA
jgi:hypothetical protein